MVIPLSADHSDAEYEGTILIENSGAAVSGVTVRLDLNTDALVDGGMLDSSFNNIWYTNAAGNSMAFMPSPTDNDQWYVYYPWSLPASSSVLSYVYMGGPDMSAPLYYLPGATGMTSADSATLEPGSDWTAEVKGYVQFPTALNTAYAILYKDNVVELYALQDGLFARGLAWASVMPLYTGISGAGSADSAGAQWSNASRGYNNNTADGASLTGVPATSWSDWIEITPSDLARVAPTATLQVYAVKNATFTQMEVQAYYGGAWQQWYVDAHSNLAYTTIWGAGCYDVGKWRIRFYNASGAAANQASILRNVQQEYFPHTLMVVGANGLTSGARTIEISYDGANITLSTGGTDYVSTGHSLGGAQSMPNYAASWTFADDSFAYVEYLKQWQGATLRQHIEYENAATFTDLSGNGNSATPSFPAASSDADVSASLLSLDPLATADAPSGSTESGGMAGTAPDEPDNLYDEMDFDHLPGATLVNALLDAGEIPRTLFWFPLTFIGIIVLSLLTYRVTKSLMGMGVVAATALVFASRAGIVPYWVTVPLILIAAAVLIKEKMSPL